MDPAVIARKPAPGRPSPASGVPGEARLRRLERLQEISRLVSQVLSPDQTLPAVCRAAGESLGFTRVALYRLDPRAQRIVGPIAGYAAEAGPAGSPHGDVPPPTTGNGSVVASPSPPVYPGRGSVGLAASAAWLADLALIHSSHGYPVELELRQGAHPAVDVALGLNPHHLANEPADPLDAATWNAWETGQPLMVVPLRGLGQTVGLMLAARPSDGRLLSAGDVEELLPFAEQAGLAIAQVAFCAESRRRVGFLSALLRISTSLTSHSELSELLQGACDQLREVSGLDAAAVYLTEEEGRMLRLHTSAGDLTARGELSAPFPIGERLAGRAALERLVIVNRNIQQDESAGAAMARRLGLQTVVCAPLLLRDELLGVLAAGTAHDMELTAEEIDLISSVAHQLAAAIANVRLLEEMRRRMEEHRRRRDELAVLYAISRAMVATIGLEERLQVIASGLTEVTGATRCVIFRRDGNSLLPWISCGDTAEEKRQFQALDIPPSEAMLLLRAVSGRKPPVVMPSAEQEPFAQMPWLAGWGVRSALWLPLAFQNRLIGLAMVYQPGEERRFPSDQVELAAAVANQAAIAIRVSQIYEQERNIAETLQRTFVPTVAARLRNFDLGQTYHPALKEAQVGGDFYDLFPLADGRVALLMADVSGKGLPAAMQTAMIKYMLRAYAVEEPTPASVLERLNRAVCTFLDPELFITAFYALLCPQSGQLEYANAGHESPILALKEPDFCTALDITGPALGLDSTVTYFTRSLSLAPGDLLLLYTDGITNAGRRAPGPKGGLDDLFGRERLEELLAALSTGKPGRIVSQIYRTVRAFAAGNLQDDCALLALKAKEVWK